MDSSTSHTPSLAFGHHGLWHKVTFQAWLSVTMDSGTTESHSKLGFPSPWTLAQSHTPSLAFRHHGLWHKSHSKFGFPSSWTLAQSHTPSLAFRHHGLWLKATLQAWLSVTMDSGAKPHSKTCFPSPWTSSGTKSHSKPGFPSPWTLAQSHTPRLAFRHLLSKLCHNWLRH